MNEAGNSPGPEDRMIEKTKSLGAEEITSWPHTVSMERYDTAERTMNGENPEPDKQAREDAAQLELAIQTKEHNMRAVQEFLLLTRNMGPDEDEGDQAILAAATGNDIQTITLMIEKDSAPPPGIAGVTTARIFTRLSRHPDWTGFNPTLPELEGTDVTVMESPDQKKEPCMVLAVTHRPEADETLDEQEFPDGLATRIRDIALWHGARSCLWFPTEDEEFIHEETSRDHPQETDDEGLTQRLESRKEFVIPVKRWCETRGIEDTSLTPDQTAECLTSIAEEIVSLVYAEGCAWHISMTHRLRDIPDPVSSPEVTRAIEKMARRNEMAVMSTYRPLTNRCVRLIEATAPTPRKNETREDAEIRATEDLAIVRLSRETGATAKEIAALDWERVEFNKDNTATVRLREDFPGDPGSHRVGTKTRRLIEAMREHSSGQGSVFRLNDGQVNRRIKAATTQAGMGKHYTAGSGGTGMLNDLLASGIKARHIRRDPDRHDTKQREIMEYLCKFDSD